MIRSQSLKIDSEKAILKGVSRSFFISLQLLPNAMRPAVSLAYLLARTSDTLADSVTSPIDLRLENLNLFESALNRQTVVPQWPVVLLNTLTDSRERRLLESTGQIFAGLQKIASGEQQLVCETLAAIISGQKLDLQRFAEASIERPVALADSDALENYAERVAGSVGIFWTKLGFLTLGPDFTRETRDRLLEYGFRYGKGLQLVNILRDLPADLAAGRCYLPVMDSNDRTALMASHQKWLGIASEWVADGKAYAATLSNRRVRAATLLPALLAEKTLSLLRGITWESLQNPVKIPRRVVYQSLIRALW